MFFPKVGKKKVLPIRTLGDPVLHTPCKEVTKVDDELRKFADVMIETMYAKDGVGLAAPQVGVSLRMVTLHVDPPMDDDGNLLRPLSPGEAELCPKMPIVLLNPKITAFSEAKETAEEGCLSVPKVYAPVERPRSIILEGDLLDGPHIKYECTGLLARAAQHEIDHLDGIVYVQRVKSPAFEEVLPAYEKIIKKSGNKEYKIRRIEE